MAIRVLHVVNPTFGKVFSGITHRLYTLLSGWDDEDITLDLLGTNLKPVNMNSGEYEYRLGGTLIWENSQELDRIQRIGWSFKILWLLILRSQQYDIVHFHSLNWGIALSSILLHLIGKKAIFSMSLLGNDNPGYISKQPRGKFMVSLLRNFDGVIGISPALIEDAQRHGIRKVMCLPNFLAISHLKDELSQNQIQENRINSRLRLKIPPESQVLLFVGGIIKRKGIDILLDSFISLAENYPKLVLVLVGPHSQKETTCIDETYVAILKKKIDKNNLPERVYWTGIIRDQNRLVEYYRSADIFVFPTRNEGLGNVLIEAMAASLPVVSSRLPGVTDEVVSDGISGYLVEPGNVFGFAQAIDRLLQNADLRYSMGEAGRKIAMKKFGFEAYCKKLKNFYRNLAGINQ